MQLVQRIHKRIQAESVFMHTSQRTTLTCSMILIFIHSFFFFRVIRYHYMFLTSDEFENRFITADFQDIDLKRAGHNLETVLPLNNTEKRHYIMVMFTNLS